LLREKLAENQAGFNGFSESDLISDEHPVQGRTLEDVLRKACLVCQRHYLLGL
jgi:hypothetical protein